MAHPSFAHERGLIAAGFFPIGVDEAGCGCLAGPVVAAALHLPLTSRIGDIRDSKLLSAGQRERLVAELRASGATWAIGSATSEEIDALNIRQASVLAMRRAVEGMLRSVSLRGNPDGNAAHSNGVNSATEAIPDTHAQPNGIAAPRSGSARNDSPRKWFALVDAWTIPGIAIPQRGIIHGDRMVKSIAAASIIAKVTRDALMEEFDRAHPQYGFRTHKGYATVPHRAAIAQHGLSSIHRRSFCVRFLVVAAT